MTFGGIKRDTTDALFSDYIRMKAGWNCEKCYKNFSTRRKGLHASHFYGRRGKSTRWFEDNAAALCSYCHGWFEEHPLEHVKFFEKRLGREAFEKLTIRAHTPAKYLDEKLVRIALRQQIDDLNLQPERS